jgi:hypothetical protein
MYDVFKIVCDPERVPKHVAVLKNMECVLIENQQMHQIDHFIVMSSQTLLHVSAYQRHHQGAHMILANYLYVGVHYKRNL